MARKSSVQNNLKRQRLQDKYAKKRVDLVEKTKNKELSIEEKFQISMALAKLPRNSSKVRYRNRCALTGRPRGFNRKIGVSRTAIRDLAGKGFLPGVIRASW